MNFEELSDIWNSPTIELEKSMQINRALVEDIGLAKIKNKLQDIKWRAIIGIPAGIYFIILVSKFMFHHLGEARFLFPALLMFVIAVFNLTMEAYRFVMYLTINTKLPVVEAQKKLVQLKKLETLDIMSLYVIMPLFSAPFIIVIAKALANLDLYQFNLTWLVYYTLGSVVISFIVIYFLRKYPNKNLTESIEFLKELTEGEEK